MILNNKRGGSGAYFYPNPVDDVLIIDLDAFAAANPPGQSPIGAARLSPTYDIRLYNGQGNLLQQQKAKSGTVQFDVSGLPDGIYYLHIYDGINSKPEMHQIVVKH